MVLLVALLVSMRRQIALDHAGLFTAQASWGEREASALVETLSYAAQRLHLPHGLHLTVYVQEGNRLAASEAALNEAVRGSNVRLK